MGSTVEVPVKQWRLHLSTCASANRFTKSQKPTHHSASHITRRNTVDLKRFYLGSSSGHNALEKASKTMNTQESSAGSILQLRPDSVVHRALNRQASTPLRPQGFQNRPEPLFSGRWNCWGESREIWIDKCPLENCAEEREFSLKCQ